MTGAKIKFEDGYPKLYVDGKITPPLMYALTALPGSVCAQKNIPLFHDVGIDIVSLMVGLDEDWLGEGIYAGEHLLGYIRDVKKANPVAKILLRVNLSAPYWWMRKYPEELIKYYGVASADTGRGEKQTGKDNTNEIKVSFVSKRWYKDVKEILKKLCCILKKSEFADSVIAIQVAYGTHGEWHMFGKYYDDGNGIFEGDYSQPMLDFFRDYLRKKYKDDKALSKAWGENVTFDTAMLATPNMRKNFRDGNRYRYPEYSMRALDSLKCFQLGAPTAISIFAECIKKEWGEGLLVGSFYGYYFGCGDVYCRLIEPHLLLRDKNIDFLAAPSAYTANKWSGNTGFLRYMAESVRLSGKIFLCEMDQGYKSYSRYHKVPTDAYICENNSEYNALMKRNIVENLLHGMGAWYFDHRHPSDYKYEKTVGYWEDEDRLAAIKQVRDFSENIYKLRPQFQNSADVLLVFDTETIYYMGIAEDIHNTYNQFDMINAISKSGAGYNTIWLYDLQKLNLDQYKCILFISCEAMRSKEYKYIQSDVMGSGRTVAFMGRNGYILDNHTSLSNMTKLYDTAIPERNCTKDRDDYTLVLIPDVMYEPTFYRDLFAKAGAHIYTDGEEVVCADNNLVMVHSKNSVQTILHLSCSDVTVQTEKYSTVVYDNLTGKRLL